MEFRKDYVKCRLLEQGTPTSWVCVDRPDRKVITDTL